jgi:hypothetical protein
MATRNVLSPCSDEPGRGHGTGQRSHAPFAHDVHAFPEDANAGKEGAVDPAPGRVDAACELPDDLAPLADEVVPAQPLRPHPVRRDMPERLELVELRVDRGRRQRGRVLEGLVGCLGGV